MRKLIASAALLALVAVGCTSTSEVMQSWVGHSEGDLIGSWGPPQATFPDGRGGHIDAYYGHMNIGQVPGHVYSNGYGGYSYTTPQNIEWDQQRMFYINADGVVYSWRWKGL